MKPIWVVDDDRSIRWVLQKALSREGLPCKVFENAEQAVEALETDRPSVLLSDIRMGEMSGVGLLEHMKAVAPDVPVVIMTAFGDLESAVSAFQGGAYEYLAKPFDISRAVDLLRRAAEDTEKGENQAAETHREPTPGIIGQSRAMQEVFRAIGRLSQSNVTVLLTGESGTGKEVVARALHRHSLRARAPFVAINTAAIPRELLESELFGHERGSFTGANAQRCGRFEQAKSGTLFLDEIGDMPMDLQTRLLRVLSDGCFYRVGGHELIRADVRVIAATNQDLEQRVRDGLFREDLFHRLNVIRLRLPALRDRKEDIGLLCEHFLEKSAATLKTERKRLSDDALAAIGHYDFPGNVRELENLCNWLTVMAPSQVIHAADLPDNVVAASGENGKSQSQATMADWREGVAQAVLEDLQASRLDIMRERTREFERVVYETALRFTEGRKVEAALKLGVGRNTLTRKLHELGMDEEE